MMTHPLRQHLLNVADRLVSDTMVPRVMGRWDQPRSRPDVLIGPTATAAQLRQLSDTLGGPLPETLREVLQEVSARIDISWVMRGRYEKADWGGNEVVTEVTPPDAFLEWDRAPNADGTPWPGAVKTPRFISGGLRLSLDQIAQAAQGVAGWQSVYPDDPQMDDDTRAHFALIRDFMGAGLPVLTAPNGDWLAIDQRDDTECMLHVSHEGEEAGMEIDLTLPGFLTHLTWLGPVWPDFGEIFTFANHTKHVVPGDYRVNEVSFDAQSEKGTEWRDWFWGDAGLPAPDVSLLGRCGGGLS